MSGDGARRPGVPPDGRDSQPPHRPASTRPLALGQGGVYLLTGVWPLLSIRTFQMVTGPKTDLWLVKTVGVLVSVIGAVLILAGVRRTETAEVPLLAAGSAAGLTAIDVIYSTRGRISKVYLLDAVFETALIGAWGVAWGKRPRRDGR